MLYSTEPAKTKNIFVKSISLAEKIFHEINSLVTPFTW